jgi:hypothetical protein
MVNQSGSTFDVRLCLRAAFYLFVPTRHHSDYIASSCLQRANISSWAHLSCVYSAIIVCVQCIILLSTAQHA